MRSSLLLIPFLFVHLNSIAQCILDLGQDTIYFCDGDCVSLDVGAGWANVLWSTGDTTESICAFETAWHIAQVESGQGCITSDSTLCVRLIHDIQVSENVICSGDTVELNANMYAETTQVGALYDTTYLPDGSGINYETQILVESYDTGATFNGNGQLLEICASLEHSYLGDLEMMLTCPNGTHAVVFNSYTGTGISSDFAGGFGGGGTFLGQPVDGAGSGIGIPWDYCFSDMANWGTLGEEHQNGNTVPVTFPSLGNSMASGQYKPEESFSAFDGCPLNGLWTITIRDNLAIDDGYIVFWGLGISNDIGEVSYHWSSGQDTSLIETPVTQTEVWADMTTQGVTCTDTAYFDFYPFPEVNIGFDPADCNQSTGQITNQTNPMDSIIMEVFTQAGIPIPSELMDPGLYDVTLTSPQGCSIDTTIEIITQIDSTDHITGATVVFPGQQFTYSVPYSACLSYSWTIDNGTIISGQGTNEVLVTWNDSISGWISVDMDETRDFNQTLVLYVGTATGINNPESDGHEVTFWNQSLKIASNTSRSQLLIISATGQLVETRTVTGSQSINCSNLAAGFYTAVLQSTKKRTVLKFAVSH